MEKANKTFEEQWHQALGHAEVTPPQQVWVAIDGQLANDQARDYKRLLIFYKWVAAACILLFVLGTVLFWQNGNSSLDSEIADAEIKSNSNSSNSNETIAQKSTGVIALDEDDNREEASLSLESDAKPTQVNNSIAAVPNPSSRGSVVVVESIPLKMEEMTIVSLHPKSASIPSTLEPWKATHLYGVARTWEEVEQDMASSPLWAGVSFSAGSFDPGYGESSGNDLILSDQIGFTSESAVPQQRTQSRPTYSAGQSVAGGLNVGKKITRRVVLSSGLHYSAFSTGSASSQLVSDELDNLYALTAETSDNNLESALSAGELSYEGELVQLTNEFQYLTIPLKAGYVLLDRKINITLNTGLAGNFRVDSRLVAEGEPGGLNNDFSTADSYERVYFNFLTSVEFGYLFKEHYQFLLEPNYNQALNDFTSSSNPNQAKPRNLGLSIGFRYNF
ncbi:MAG: hypothetical protein ABJF11_02975 [Reichenbachiella sp.]|uniref:outer membrane beta-barrel protein n=1 Tax=Reichenbachiella sp. TaxID=2184521 RepID=UPI0032653B12